MTQAAATAPDDTTSQRARAYQGFTQQIFTGGIRAGQFISQRELMALLDMPLGAVREMIPRLEAAGLVKTVPQRGLQVAHVDLKLIRNAFQVRSMIEREAVLNFVRSASETELAAIEASHRDILQRAEAPDALNDVALLDDAQAVDWGLHDRMVDALGNDIISEQYRVNSLRVRLIKLEHSVITPSRLIPAMQEHLRFIEALRQRNAALAVELLEDHISSARSRVMNAPLDQVRSEWNTPHPPRRNV
ncbi:MAG: GntR family transcriptional regulator [Curvibacter sp. RIFCSPHIGHO2_12_FULL_63_18]|uniref:GntR family transcriptional regulator n=1 Tax=Rhodoferax sp. TaxID=50421 RepID=UPI0008ACE9A4|nr:GntR family transcriptional regulator [Rhodoferax sp.]OGO94981.1 MAG: GntR family transcriptional regulator [Curvibacter sp. GWA2_63_95]OGP05175.1 MAG: GntR family transcriptional regulator [Curvibacter sp. RIFCSPHIGHO2_12_FULL_63_18]HCX82310.1 GntR family transcriptional regulator [Rhodoferax sp.]